MRLEAESRLIINRHSASDNAQEMSERDAFDKLFSQKLAKFAAVETNLFFGRLLLSDGEEINIGKMGIHTEINQQLKTLLYDWRTPIGGKFYSATTINPESVIAKQYIKTTKRQINQINTEYFIPELLKNNYIENITNESYLLEALNASRSEKMQDIASTIQREQYNIIRSNHKSVLIIQGGPGTGKTAVALHRVAYLLYHNRNILTKSGVLIIGPNHTFLEYINQVLPDLGENQIFLTTLGSLYPNIVATKTDIKNKAIIKGSLQMSQILLQAIKLQQKTPNTDIKIKYHSNILYFTKKMLLAARAKARSSKKPHNKARNIFIITLIKMAHTQFSTNTTNNHSYLDIKSLTEYENFKTSLLKNQHFIELVNNFWPQLNPETFLLSLYNNKSLLTDLSKNGILPVINLWQPISTHPYEFTIDDIPLLDELADLIGVDSETKIVKKTNQHINSAQAILDTLHSSKPIDIDDEADPEILMAYNLINADTLAERHEYKTEKNQMDKIMCDREWTFGHIVVDEAQELSQMAWKMLFKRIPSKWITAVGDISQTTNPAGSYNWEKTFFPFVKNRWKYHELTINYRTPAKIMNLAKDVIKQINPTAATPISIRDNDKPPIAINISKENLAQYLIKLAEKFPPSRSKIFIAEQTLIKNFTTKTNLNFLTPNAAKGLEFDIVILIYPDELLEKTNGLANLLVGITRATQQLIIVYENKLPEYFNSIKQITLNEYHF